MKKKIATMCCAVMMVISMLLVSVCDTKAASDEPILDGSYLTHEEESVGYDTKKTRGEDLLVGYSKIRKVGPGEISAGGTTIATHEVERVKVAVIVERAKEEDESWGVYETWQKENENATRAASSQTLKVEGGYYYRVRSVHSANDDVSSSFTDGIYIE